MIDYSGKRSMEEVTRFLHGELVVRLCSSL